MEKLRTEQEVSHWTRELRAGPLYPLLLPNSLPILFSLSPPALAQKRVLRPRHDHGWTLIQIPPIYCVSWAGCLTSLSHTLLLCTLRNKFIVARRNPCRLGQVLG